MALKDWIQTYDIKKDGQVFRRRADYQGVVIDTFKPAKYGYSVTIKEASNYLLKHKSFHSKASALKFAKNYMEKN